MIKRWMIVLLSGILFVTVQHQAPLVARAATLTVTSLADDGSTGTLRSVIAAAGFGDTITFQSGLTGQISLGAGSLFLSKNLTITGPGAGTISIDGLKSTQIFSVYAANVTISGLTLQHGFSSSGNGGAIGITGGGALTLESMVIQNNGSNGDAGGVDVALGTTLTIDNSTFSGNTTPAGGLHNGGAVHASGATVTITNSTFTGNHAALRGGAIHADLGTNLRITNSTFVKNDSGDNGGAISVETQQGYPTTTALLDSITVAYNQANSSGSAGGHNGGGLYNDDSLPAAVTILNSIVAQNAAPNSSCVDVGGSVGTAAPFTSRGYNLIGNAACGTGFGVSSDQLNVTAPGLAAALADNGGPTQTLALVSGSPSIGAGTCSQPSDQRGLKRVTTACDIGAYAFTTTTSGLAKVTSLADDGGAGTLRTIVAHAAPGDIVTFAAGLSGTIVLTQGAIAIGHDLTINGPGSRTLTVSGSNASQIFTISASVVTLSGLTLANGSTTASGGAIHNNGTLSIVNDVLSDNSETSASGEGGAIYNVGTLNVTGSTFVHNAAAFAGAISNHGTAHVAASTFSGNLATVNGGAIDNAYGILNVVNSTFSGNSASYGNSIDSFGTTDIENSIMSSSASGRDCNNGVNYPAATGTNNLSDGSCPGTSAAVTGLDTVLANNGGPTPTIALIGISNARAALATCTYPGPFSDPIFNSASDQRGVTRTAPCAIGAYDDTDPGNLTWTSATLLTPNITASADQVLNQAGQSRWYKFKVQPGTQVTLTLTNVPAEYDLTLYKDISSTYTQITSPQSLTEATAQDAPDHFAPDHLAPDHLAPDHLAAEAFAPDHLAPDHFAADVFAPDHLAPDQFAPDHLAPDHLAPDAYAPDHLAPDTFAPDHLAPDHLAPDHLAQDNAYTSAQTRSLIGISAFPGTIGQGITANTWLNTGYFYIRVRGSNGVFDPAHAFHLSVTQPNGTCASLDTSTLPATSLSALSGGYKTIILTNPSRMSGSGADKSALFGINGVLQTFASRSEVAGAVVDVSTDARVAAAYALADANNNCPAAQNVVANAIKALVTAYRQQNSTVQYVVIVGDDHVIPFFRHPDQASLGSESTFTPPVRDSSSAQASLQLDYTLSQDDYGASTSIAVNVDQFPIPQLAVGRLVQTPSEVSGMLAAYTDAHGVVSPGSSLVTGYDFLQPVASAVQGVLTMGTGATPDTLIEDRTKSPQDPTAWNADQLRGALLNTRHDIIFLAGHFSQSTALAADYTTHLFSTDIANPAVIAAGTFKNAIVFSNGCHSGYGVDSADDVPSLTLEPNWPQAFAQTQATLIAGTGYQYGDSDFIKYSESIYLDFSKQLLVGSGAVPIGTALNLAKQQYLAETPQLNGIEAKSELEITLYGLPMLGVNMPAGRTAIASDPSIVSSTTAATSNPGLSRGLSSADVVVTPSLTTKTVGLTTIDFTTSPTPTPVTATYLAGANGVVVEPAQPVLPLETRNVSVPGTTLRGIGFRSGDYSETANVLPFTDAATTELRGVHPFFQSDVQFPIKPWSANYFGALTDPTNPTTRLSVIPAQYRSSAPGSTTGTLRQFGHMNFRLFYSNYTGNAAGSSAPYITLVSATPSADGSSVLFSAHATDDPAAGIQAVWVTYTSTAGGPSAGQWQSLDLMQDGQDSTLWTGTLQIPAGTDPTTISYMVQAASGTGLISLDTNDGAYYTPVPLGTMPGNLPAALPPTTLSLSTPPTSGAYGDVATFNATLTSNGAPVSGQPVAITLGSRTAEAKTDASGNASVAFTLSDLPGTYQPVAIFGGTSSLAPSSAQNVPAFTETQQHTHLSLSTPSSTITSGNDAQVSATLTDGNGAALGSRSVIFVLTNSTSAHIYSLATITNVSGRSTLGAVPIVPGLYTVTTYFDGGTIPVGTIGLNDPGATPTSASIVIPSTDPNYISAMASSPLTVAPAVSIRSAAPTGSTYGQTVTFTALVDSSFGTPSGAVTFYDGDVSNPISCTGSGDGALNGGKATCSTSSLTAGSHSISASYAGDATFPGNSSSVLSQNVNPAALAVTANPITVVYGTAMPTPSATITGFVNGETAGVLTGSPSCVTSVAIGASAGTYSNAITCSQGTLQAANYSFSFVPNTVTVQKAAATIALQQSSLDQDYTGTPRTIGYSTNPAGLAVSMVYSQSGTALGGAPSSAGTYSATVTITDPNYEGTVTTGFVIDKASSTINLGGLSQIYDGTPKFATATTKPAGLNAMFSYSQNGNPVTAPTNAGMYAVTATLSDPNYKGSVSGQLVIAKATATVKLTTSDLNQTYDGTMKAVRSTVSPSGLVVSVIYSQGGTQIASPVAAGTYSVTATVNDPNYQGTVTDTLMIGKATLTVTANSQTITLHAQLPTFSAAISGFVNGEVASSAVTGTPVCSTTATASSPVGTYPITCTAGTLSAANYTFIFAPGTLTIGYKICLLYDPTQAKNSGSTIPVQIQLCDANSTNVSNSSIVLHAVSVDNGLAVQSPGNSQPGNNFRFSGNQYQFNLKTSGYSSGKHLLYFTVGSGPVQYTTPFTIR